VLPFGQRQKLWDRHRAKARKHKQQISVTQQASEVCAGSQVCMKNSPMYQAGAIGEFYLTSDKWSFIHISVTLNNIN
jgi:E3 ubiquitin-protein ligase EDD1